MRNISYLAVILILIHSIFFLSCKKFLIEKPNAKLSTPGSFDDLQAMLDNNNILNRGPVAMRTASDEYYLSTNAYNAVANQWDKDAFIWEGNTQLETDWLNSYKIVYYANSILDNLDLIEEKDQLKEYGKIRGSALFFRCWAFYHIAQLFATPYDKNTADREAGIPLRLDSDFSIPSNRASLRNVYEQLIRDLKEAIVLLPDNTLYKTRPSNAAANALLAKVYLLMGDFEKAKTYATAVLNLYKELIDYNTLDSLSSAPFSIFNQETIFHSTSFSSGTLTGANAKIDSILYKSYDSNDLRKYLFYQINSDGSYRFKGSYSGSNSSSSFNGMAIDEMYFMQSECFARLNNPDSALIYLNKVLETRWRRDTYVPYEGIDGNDLIAIILEERMKELVFRGTRWSDIRRLNLEGANIILNRFVNDKTYTLLPGDPRFTFLIPESVIKVTNMIQNPR